MQEVYQQELSRLQLAAALGRAGQATSNGDPASAPTAAPGAASPKSAATAGAEGEGEKDSSTITATPSDKESAEKGSPPIPEHLGNFWEFSREPIYRVYHIKYVKLPYWRVRQGVENWSIFYSGTAAVNNSPL